MTENSELKPYVAPALEVLEVEHTADVSGSVGVGVGVGVGGSVGS